MLANSISSEDGSKVHGIYKRLAVFKDEEDIWRVGLRMKEFTPFTYDQKAPVFLPRNSRLTMLLMEESHRYKHSGVSETVARFRMLGYWTPQAAKLAKQIKNRCVTCKLLDKRP